MAKQIIVQSVSPQVGGETMVNVVFWFPVASGKEYPRPNAGSVYPGAQAAEITAIQAGSVIEESRSYIIPSNYTKAQAEAFLLAAFNSRQTYLGTRPAVGEFYGVSYDGSAWSS